MWILYSNCIERIRCFFFGFFEAGDERIQAFVRSGTKWLEKDCCRESVIMMKRKKQEPSVEINVRKKNMKFDNVYFFNGTAYAGKSTMVKRLAEKHNGIACEENYHEALMDDNLDWNEFPNLGYTVHLKDWAEFVRRTPEEYASWIEGGAKEGEILELRILEDLVRTTDKKIFVDTNISLETLKRISDRDHVMIMLADPQISVSRFFDRPDSEKQFLYQLLLKEKDPEAAMANFRKCLEKVNSQENYDKFLHSGFQVLLRDENRSIEKTLQLVEECLKL